MGETETALDPGVPVLAESALTDRVDRPAPVLILFYADWCPFCKQFLPVFRERMEGRSIDAVAANLSHPDDPRWETYEVDTIPTVIAFRDGSALDRLDGVPGEGLSAEELDAFLDEIEDEFA